MTEAKEETWEIWVKLGNDKSSAISIVNTATVDTLHKQLIATFKKLGGCDPGELVVKAPKESFPAGSPLKSVDPTTFKQELDEPRAKLAEVLKPAIAGVNGEYDIYVELPANRKEAQMIRLENRLRVMEREQAMAKATGQEPALGLFDDVSDSPSLPRRNGCRPLAAEGLRPQSECWMCGAANATMAHILPGTQDMSKKRPDKAKCLAAVNAPRFASDYAFDSWTNLIMLCGTKDLVGTCRYYFDHHKVAVVYNPFTQVYNLIWFVERDNPPQELKVPPGFKPQRRGFAFHALKALKDNQYSNRLLTQTDMADMFDNALQLSCMSLSEESKEKPMAEDSSLDEPWEAQGGNKSEDLQEELQEVHGATKRPRKRSGSEEINLAPLEDKRKIKKATTDDVPENLLDDENAPQTALIASDQKPQIVKVGNKKKFPHGHDRATREPKVSLKLRLAEFPGQGLVIQGTSLFCSFCSMKVSNRKGTLKGHLNSRRHSNFLAFNSHHMEELGSLLAHDKDPGKV